MGQKPAEERKQEPNLELPALFGRRKKRRASDLEPTDHGPTDHEQSVPPPAVETDLLPAADAAPEGEPTAATQAARDTEPRKPRPGGRRAARAGGRPAVPGPVAAVLTGLVVGLFGAGATYGGTVGCEAWRGTSSCGGGPGLLLLVVILALMVLLGAGALALFGVPEPRSTSFLGVGLTFVVVLVALMSTVFSVWMFFAVPVLSAAAYGVAHWVTTRNVELPEAGPEHDVR